MGVSLNQETCKNCAICTAVCPVRIFKKNGKTVRVDSNRVDLCLHCGHCLAQCATRSIQVDGFSYDTDIFDLPESKVGYDDLRQFLLGRRSIRNFKEQAVPREIIEKILAAVETAPYGVGPTKVEITVVPDRETIARALPHIAEFLGNFDKWLRNPLIRFMMKHRVALDKFTAVEHHVLPMARKQQYVLTEGHDGISRHAPTLLLFHAHREAEDAGEDALIDVTYAFLAAHALGLGATVIGLIPPAINKVKEVRQIFRIPEDHVVYTSLILGYPKYRFQRGIRRPAKQVHWL